MFYNSLDVTIMTIWVELRFSDDTSCRAGFQTITFKVHCWLAAIVCVWYSIVSAVCFCVVIRKRMVLHGVVCLILSCSDTWKL